MIIANFNIKVQIRKDDDNRNWAEIQAIEFGISHKDAQRFCQRMFNFTRGVKELRYTLGNSAQGHYIYEKTH